MIEEDKPKISLFKLNTDCIDYLLNFFSLPELLIFSKSSKSINIMAQNKTKLNPNEIYILRRRFRAWKKMFKKTPVRRAINSWTKKCYHPDLRVIF
jgi:hypothetical protein